MSTENPFARPPDEPMPAYVLSDSAVPTGKPGGLLAFCIITIVLASFGSLSVLVTVGSVVFGEAMQTALIPPSGSGQDNEMARFQREMNAETLAVSKPFQPLQIGLAMVQLVCCGMLLAGSIGALRLKHAGRVWLIRACVVTIVLELVRAVMMFWMSIKIQLSMGDFMPRFLENAEAENMQKAEQVAQTMGAAMKFGVIFGMIFTAGWLVVKVVFYLLEIRYFQRPTTQKLFTSADSKPDDLF